MMLIVHMWSRIPMLLLTVAFQLAFGAVHYESCVADSKDCGIGSSLLQATSAMSKPTKATKKAEEVMDNGRNAMTKPTTARKKTMEVMETDRNAMRKLTKIGPKSHVLKGQPAVGKARDILPHHLYQLGLKLFGKEEVLDAVVADTVEVDSAYAGVKMTLRMVTGNVVTEGDVYGVDSLSKEWALANAVPTGMMNMMDIGGNYGRVTIAAFSNYPSHARIIVLEPVPSTYFLLRWNLWLNKIPELRPGELRTSPDRPGVVALNNAVADVAGTVTDLCYTPPHTMAARVCNCSKGFTRRRDEQCNHMIGRTVRSLFQMFGAVRNQALTFLKMDCEGCEAHVIPALRELSASSGLRIGRFAGELHAVPNDLEDVACKLSGGQWFVHICSGKGTFAALPLHERCSKGPGRKSCSRLTNAQFDKKRHNPSEWLRKWWRV